MNKRTIRVIIDMLIAIVISVSAHQLLGLILSAFEGFHVTFILRTLIWLALRHGASTAILAAVITDLINSLLE